MIIQTGSIEELPQAAEQLLHIAPNYKIFLFFGDMGAGKTTLIKSVCKVLGVNDLVSSPTFSIINEYASASGPVYHFDFYRLKNDAEAFDLGLDEYFYSGNYCFIEWPERIENFWPESFVQVDLKTLQENNRSMEIRIIG